MKQLTCEMCGGNDLIKQEGVFVCQHCGAKYSLEEAKKLLIEGTIEVKSTITIDDSPNVEKYLVSARRAYKKSDWENAVVYYRLVEQNRPYSIEACFFSAFSKLVLSFSNGSYSSRSDYFEVLRKSISSISEYYEETTEDKEQTFTLIANAMIFLVNARFDNSSNNGVTSELDEMKRTSIIETPIIALETIGTGSFTGSIARHMKWFKIIRSELVTQVRKIQSVHNEPFLQEFIKKIVGIEQYLAEAHEKGLAEDKSRYCCWSCFSVLVLFILLTSLFGWGE